MGEYENRFRRYPSDESMYKLAQVSNIDEEISKLSQEMNDINIDSIPFDKWDYIVMFSVGMLESIVGLLVSSPKEGISKKLSDKNSPYGSKLNELHEKWNHSKQPLDYQGPKFGGGDHRARTFGHDLLALPLALYMLTQGKFIDGYYDDGAYQTVMSALNQHGNEYAQMPFEQALLAYLTHMAADFCSTKSLPVPGFGLLAHLSDRDVRKFVADAYSEGFNLRHVFVQGLPVAMTEIVIRLYCWLQSRTKDISSEAKKHKRDKMLLVCHTMALLVNTGKVVIMQDPTSINLPMLLRVIWLTWSVIRQSSSLSHNAIVKVNISVIKTKLEELKTLIILDQAVFYSDQALCLFQSDVSRYNMHLAENSENTNKKFADIRDKILEMRKLK